jgi:hypothetical protein
MGEPRRLTTIWASTTCYRTNFAFTVLLTSPVDGLTGASYLRYFLFLSRFSADRQYNPLSSSGDGTYRQLGPDLQLWGPGPIKIWRLISVRTDFGCDNSVFPLISYNNHKYKIIFRDFREANVSVKFVHSFSALQSLQSVPLHTPGRQSCILRSNNE